MSVTVTAPATYTTTVTSNAAAATIASASTTGTAKFNTDNFAVSGAGDVTIKNAGVLLTAEVTGTLPIANGGTGATSAAMIGVVTAANATAARAVLELGTAALVATGTGATNAILGNDARLTDARTPSSTLDHSTDKLTSGTLPVGRGGTGLTAVTTLLNSNQAYSDISGTPTLGTAAALAVGISNTNVLQADANVADDDFLRVAGTQIEGRTAAETLSDIGASPTAGNASLTTTGTIGTGVWNATAILDTKIDLRVDHGVTFDGGGSVIETAKVVLVPVERAGVIKAATLVGDASGAITITITKYDPAADATTLGSAAAVGSIALATKIINRDTTLSGWTLAVAEGDVLAFTTGGTIATVTRVTCKLKVELA